MSEPEPGTSDAKSYSIDVVDDVRSSQRVPGRLSPRCGFPPNGRRCGVHGAQRTLDMEPGGLEFWMCGDVTLFRP